MDFANKNKIEINEVLQLLDACKKKINIDHNQAAPQKYAVRSIPTLMLFKNGDVQAQRMGALSKSQLKDFLDTNL